MRWRYPPEPGGRDLRLDFLRGWCIFSMVVDHAAGDSRNTFLFHVTGNGGYPLTGAHGFVLISGVVMGILYGDLLTREGVGGLFTRALSRAFKLYLVAVALGLIEYAFGFTGLGGGSAITDFSPSVVVGILILHSGADDLMTFYAALVLAAPILLLLMRNGKTWVVALASLALWMAHLHYPDQVRNPAPMFAPIADWQVLFVAGLLMGYHRKTLARVLSGRRRRAYLGVLFALFALLLFIQVRVVGGAAEAEVLGHDFSWTINDIYSDYDHNPALHMLALFVWLLALYHLVDWLWVPLRRALGWFAIPLGQAALYVYTVHVLLVYLLLVNMSWFMRLNAWMLGVVELGLMLLLWFLVKRRFLFKVIPR